MTISRRQLLAAAPAAGVLTATAIGRSAWAQSNLELARVITGFAPGGTADVISRRVADKMHPGYARSVLVDNRTGAGGQIAVQYVKAAAADGATVLQTPMSMLCIYPHIYKKLPYDPVADLTPVSMGCVFDLAFSVGRQVPANVKTVSDYLLWAKANPSKTSFGVPAAGSVSHFMGVLLGRAGDVELQQVAYRGTLPAIQDMIGGQIPAVCGPVGEFTQFVKAGSCRLLATAGSERSRFAPDVPTLVEQGFKNMVYRDWFGFYLPPKVTSETVQRLNSALVAALASPDVVNALATIGLEALSSTPGELAARQRTELMQWEPLVRSIGFSADS
ncbi:MAG: Bug family tripartite tricarboxylate transporter substrate binding protein [Proteobacteria bacterium]|nr:Bug family tripartite tricarboxylate transporter substrate binding protein [Pseudomonadota bacterium]